jgi:hypothetical protein
MLVDGDFTWWRGATFLTEVDASASRAAAPHGTDLPESRDVGLGQIEDLQSRDGRGAHEVSSFNSASGRRIRRPRLSFFAITKVLSSAPDFASGSIPRSSSFSWTSGRARVRVSLIFRDKQENSASRLRRSSPCRSSASQRQRPCGRPRRTSATSLPIEDGTIGADSLESLGFLMAELGDLAAACMTLAAHCRRAAGIC